MKMFGNAWVVAIFETHDSAETGVRSLSAAGFAMKDLGIVGKGFHSEAKVVGFYNVSQRVDCWARRGAFWGGLGGILLAGLTTSIPAAGGVLTPDYMTSAVAAIALSAFVAGGLGALGAALYSVGIPEDSVIAYKTELKADRFLLTVRGDARDLARAEDVLYGSNLICLDLQASDVSDGPNAKPVSISA